MNPEYFSSIPTVVGKLSNKSDEQMQRLKNVLDGSFFFADLSQEKMSILLDSMEEVRFNGVNSEVIISKRVDADQMYIIEKGNPSRVKKDKADDFEGNPKYKVHDVFGEVDLLFDRDKYSTRVICHSRSTGDDHECILWQLKRKAFNHVMLDSPAAEKRQTWFGFIRSVELVKQADDYEKYLICDAVQVLNVKAGEEIFKKGEMYKSFYIIHQGTVDLKNEDDPYFEVIHLKKGQFFGEECMLKGERGSSVAAVAMSDTTLAAFSAKAFQRFFAGYSQTFEASMHHYHH
jgi:signal-transduction protein with cAMP-binding, CBS, and nucleotidyltransferase domain